MIDAHYKGGGVMSLSFDVDSAGVDAAEFGLSEAAARRVMQRATTKTAKWMRVRVVRFIAGYMGTAQSNLKPRVAVRKARRDSNAVLWIGTNDVDPVRLNGDAEDIGTGAMSGEWFFDGSFAATMENGKRGIYKRQGNKRLPIDLQRVNVDDPVDVYMDRLLPVAERQLRKVIEQELNFELHKAAF